MIAELDPEPAPEAYATEEGEAPKEPKEEPMDAPKAKARGRPPGSKNKAPRKPKAVAPVAQVAQVAQVAPVAQVEPYSRRDLLRATQFFASQLGNLQKQRMDTKRTEWRALFQ